MQTQTLCAQVARRTGERLRTIERRGFQPLTTMSTALGPKLAAVDCPFCGEQVLVAAKSGTFEAECRGCDTAFAADEGDVYQVAVDAAERPKARRFLHEVW